MNVQAYRRDENIWEVKARALMRIVAQNNGHCAVCWTWEGSRTPRHAKIVGTCRNKPEGTLNLTGFRGLKKARAMPTGYCWRCWMPAGMARPPEHGEGECDFNDWGAQIVWAVWAKAALWEQARVAFPSLPVLGGAERRGAGQMEDERALGIWCGLEEEGKHFVNAIELILWRAQQIWNGDV
jgi:hypothetical protein